MTACIQLTMDLHGLTQRDALSAIGAALCLRGPDGKHAVHPGETRGWGMNWDALFDCQLKLHPGGIWGNSPVPDFTRAACALQSRQFDFELVALA